MFYQMNWELDLMVFLEEIHLECKGHT